VQLSISSAQSVECGYSFLIRETASERPLAIAIGEQMRNLRHVMTVGESMLQAGSRRTLRKPAKMPGHERAAGVKAYEAPDAV
jgi:hypothetical protein